MRITHKNVCHIAYLEEKKNAILQDTYFFQKLKQTSYSQEAQIILMLGPEGNAS